MKTLYVHRMTVQPALHSSSHTPRLILVDGSGYIFRAYHALPPLTRPDGTAVGAVYGFTTMMFRLREQYARDHLAVIFDASRISFRQDIYPEYKANRPPAPEDLVPQFALVRKATEALGIPAIELEGVEADDVIASYADAAHAQGVEVLIISSDKDLMQLIRPGVAMLDPMKNKAIGEAQVIEKFGVPPEKVIEVQALIGDSVDNVPGVPGIGPKTAAELILQYGTLDNLLNHLGEIKQPKRRESLEQHAANARLSYTLVQLKRDVALPVSLDALNPVPLDNQNVLAFLREQNFTSLLKKMGQESAPQTLSKPAIAASAANGSPALGAQDYITIRDSETLAQWVREAIAQGYVAIDTETTSLHIMQAELVGVSLALAPGKAAYIPIGHVVETETGIATAQSSLFDTGGTQKVNKLAEGQLTLEQVRAGLAPLLTHTGVLKIGHNIKYDLGVLANVGITLSPVADTMLMSYVTSAGLHGQGLDELAMQHFGYGMKSFKELVGSGKTQKLFSEVPIADAMFYAAEDADFTLRLYETLKPEMLHQHVVRVYETIDRPLIPVVVAMEREGIAIDTIKLAELSADFANKLEVLEREIHALAGTPFMVSSPKQLGEVLFEKLNIAGGKKSPKTGAYTTDAETLEQLAEQGHAIAKKVLEWRHLAKLKSTYTDTLPLAQDATTGRVHTSYALAATTTGRLSSSDPNLQNIPIRSEEGKRIREAFIAKPGYALISADYSQIELRLLAHVAEMEGLRQAFRDGKDIHAITASQMFATPLAQVSGDQRRQAKTINFGIIYGISAHGLAMRLGISRQDAASYIELYFRQYPGIRAYMDTTIAFARAHGYVETLFGRRVYVKDINAKNGNLRAFSERAAINAPLQGAAADIIKRAMVEVAAMLSAQSPNSRMLLQVHDELVIEAPEQEAASLAQHIKKTMERVAQLSVPLTVEVGVGKHWGEIH
jgi:DNA polymerase-1